MTRIRLFTAIAVSVAGVAMTAVAGGAASATPSKWEPFHDEGGPFVNDDFAKFRA
jgi:hypothetical protein